jgi:nicotinate-nucleotide adenylyltransferase
MRIGLFGGSFDPPHLGHLILAEQVRDSAQLDEVWFLPSYRPPHKETPASRFDQRCEMVELAIIGQPKFRVEPIEKELPPPSYTIETLRELRERHPEHEFHLIIGGDSLVDFPTWYQPQAILGFASLIAVDRPGSPPMSPEQLAHSLGVPSEQVRLNRVESPQIGIASREIRARVAAGASIRYLVPRSVEEYLREKKLYLTPS